MTPESLPPDPLLANDAPADDLSAASALNGTLSHDNTAPDNLDSDHATTDDALSDDALSDDALSDDALSDDALNDDALSDDALSDDAEPENPFEAQLQAQGAFTSTEPPMALTGPPMALAGPSLSGPAPRRRAVWPWLLLLVPVLGGGAYIAQRKREADALYRRNHAPIVMPDRMAHVPAAWNARTLGDRLQQKNKVLDAAAFREAAAQVGLDQVTPGSYFLPAQASPLDLARAFKAGPTHRDVTFPEGFTAMQFVARLRKQGFAGAEKMAAIPPTQLEGTLFPATYELPISGNGSELIGQFQARWKTEMAKLPRPFPKVGGKELTPMQVLTLASIVERETNSDREMPLVAGVLVGRLRKPMRLQVDASVQYARLLANQGHKERLFNQDLGIDSPYNTYKNDGLPPSPICNPGAAALLAAARPAPTDALFYVYSPKLKHHLFAKTYAEHLHNVAQVRLERAASPTPAAATAGRG